MTNVMNSLPIGVHVQSGGDARIRVGGSSIPMDDVSGGSFQVTNGTRYRLFVNLRTTQVPAVLIGYVNPLALDNTSFVCIDLDEITDDVPEGTTVYFKLIDPATLDEAVGGEDDFINVSIYG